MKTDQLVHLDLPAFGFCHGVGQIFCKVPEYKLEHLEFLNPLALNERNLNICYFLGSFSRNTLNPFSTIVCTEQLGHVYQDE